LAILVPRRGYATETTPHTSNDGPPPGFDINEAKKPLAKDGDKKASSTPSVAELKKSEEMLETPKEQATMIDKTKALEKASLSELAAEKKAHTTSTSAAAKKEESKKLTLGQKIKKEIMHYWDGTKLLAAEVRISSRLALKMAAGYDLSRRESRQVRSSCPGPRYRDSDVCW
jgi:LETM1 and EF-hand domain-containing protein 1